MIHMIKGFLVIRLYNINVLSLFDTLVHFFQVNK